MQLIEITMLLLGLTIAVTSGPDLAERQLACPAGSPIINIILSTVVTPEIVVIEQFFKANTIISLNGGCM